MTPVTYIGNSLEVKETVGVILLSEFWETDTGNTFVWTGADWLLKEGGSGAGAAGTLVSGTATSDGATDTLYDNRKNFAWGDLIGATIVINRGGVEYLRTIIATTGTLIQFSPVLFAGTTAGFVYGDVGAGQITVECVDPSLASNDYTCEITAGLEDSTPTSAEFTDGVIYVVLGTDADGVVAGADIGSGANGTVTIQYITEGEIGNGYTVEVVIADGASLPMSAELTDKHLVVTLGTDGAGDPDAAKNIATVIATAVETIAHFNATASGTGDDPLTIAEAEQPFLGGVNPTVNGTATQAADVIEALPAFTATMTGAGGVLAPSALPIDFAGGLDPITTLTDDTYYVVAGTGLINESRVERFTGIAALSNALTALRDFQIEEVRGHLSAVGTAGNLTITQDSVVNGVFDTLLYKQDMTTITDFSWKPTSPIKLTAGDNVSFAWANASGRTYGIEVVYSLI